MRFVEAEAERNGSISDPRVGVETRPGRSCLRWCLLAVVVTSTAWAAPLVRAAGTEVAAADATQDADLQTGDDSTSDAAATDAAASDAGAAASGGDAVGDASGDADAEDEGGLSWFDDRLTLALLFAGAYQYQFVGGGTDDDEGGAAGIAQAEIGFAVTEADEIFAKLGFAAGNGINDGSAFVLAPFAADLHDDVLDINGRGRDYLLTAWYKHTFTFSDDHTLGLTGGIIDATDYLDQNTFANDEYTQFMNEALVNGPNGFAPSYDYGGAIEWAIGDWSVNTVIMRVGENDDGNEFTFVGGQLGRRVDTPWGEGNYRLIVLWASSDFLDTSGTSQKSRLAVLFSADQRFGEILGAWVRIGGQDDGAAITYESLFSGGVDISGTLWGRADDNLGVGYGFLNGGNVGVERTHVLEMYLRLAVLEMLAVTIDAQYMVDDFSSGAGPRHPRLGAGHAGGAGVLARPDHPPATGARIVSSSSASSVRSKSRIRSPLIEKICTSLRGTSRASIASLTVAPSGSSSVSPGGVLSLRTPIIFTEMCMGGE